MKNKLSPMPIVNLLAFVMLIVLSAHGIDFLVGKYNGHLSLIRTEVGETSFREGYALGREEAFDEMGILEDRIMSNLMVHHERTKKTAENYIHTERMIDKIIDKSNPKLSDKKRAEYKKYIIKWSRKFDLSPVFIAAMIHRETNFNEKAVSKVKARGALQILAKWHPEKLKRLGIKEADLHSINHGIHIGCEIIRQYLDWNDGDYRAALEKYVGAVNNSADGYIKDIFAMVIYAHKKDAE